MTTKMNVGNTGWNIVTDDGIKVYRVTDDGRTVFLCSAKTRKPVRFHHVLTAQSAAVCHANRRKRYLQLDAAGRDQYGEIVR